MPRKQELWAELSAIERWESLPCCTGDSRIEADAQQFRRIRRTEIFQLLAQNVDCDETSFETKVSPILCKLAHHLQNKLSVIMGQCDLLLEKRDSGLTQDCVQRLDSIKQSALAMSEIIKQSDCPGGAH
jgi:light-regulated signal transduction histidine kinase (bacteriophytochrome)